MRPSWATYHLACHRHLTDREGSLTTAIAVFLLLVTLAAACLLAAARWPHGGRIAASAVIAAMALGPAVLAVPAFMYAGDSDQAGSFGADVAATYGIVMAGAGAVLVGLAVAVLRGNDEVRGLVAALLGAVGGLWAYWIMRELAEGGDHNVNTASVLLSAVGVAGIGAAALLVGASGAMSRLQLWRR